MRLSKVNPFDKVFLLEPDVFEDDRGYFFESYREDILKNEIESDIRFVQDNHSVSSKGVLRGLHYQWNEPMGKLVRVSQGSVIDVIVDIRESSETFGKHRSVFLSEKNKFQIWIPPGFAHGFLSLEDNTHFLYKCTAYYNKDGESSISPYDSNLNIQWNEFYNADSILLSDRDASAQTLSEYMKDFKF